MLTGLTLAANASLYWLGSWFDVEPTHGDKMTDMLTTERKGGAWVWEVDVFESGYVRVYMGTAAIRLCVGS